MPIQQNKGKKDRFLSGFCVTYDDRGGGGDGGFMGHVLLVVKKKYLSLNLYRERQRLNLN